MIGLWYGTISLDASRKSTGDGAPPLGFEVLTPTVSWSVLGEMMPGIFVESAATCFSYSVRGELVNYEIANRESNSIHCFLHTSTSPWHFYDRRLGTLLAISVFPTSSQVSGGHSACVLQNLKGANFKAQGVQVRDVQAPIIDPQSVGAFLGALKIAKAQGVATGRGLPNPASAGVPISQPRKVIFRIRFKPSATVACYVHEHSNAC